MSPRRLRRTDAASKTKKLCRKPPPPAGTTGLVWIIRPNEANAPVAGTIAADVLMYWPDAPPGWTGYHEWTGNLSTMEVITQPANENDFTGLLEWTNGGTAGQEYAAINLYVGDTVLATQLLRWTWDPSPY